MVMASSRRPCLVSVIVLQDVEPLGDQRRKPAEALLLRWIVLGQTTQTLQQAWNLGDGAVDRLEIGVALGEQEPALAGFGGAQLAEEAFAPVLHLESVGDEPVGLLAAHDEDCNRQRRRQQ